MESMQLALARLFADGHASWRKFREMAIRYRVGGSRPIFWF
jgi:hypothetical protein